MVVTRPNLSNRVLALYQDVLQTPNNVDAIVALSRELADSGTRRPTDSHSADVASSGGPSSLSTLLCPLHLVAAGLRVPKIGVEGRPAGGLDVLGTVPGYRVQLSSGEYERVLSTARHAHVVADLTWAPADAVLFRLRQEQGTQAIPSLAIASLLAKKLAGGVSVAGLEARVAAHGNFGATVTEARENADIYCEVARKLGLVPVVVLTDARVPYQPYIGRGEALTALKRIVYGQVQDSWLADHAELCSRIAGIVARHGRPLANDGGVSAPIGLSDALGAHLRAQGSSLGQLEERVQLVSALPRTVVRAENDGFVHYNLRKIRHLLLAAQSTSTEPRSSVDSRRVFADDHGVRLMSAPWNKVRRGDPIMEFRSTGELRPSTLHELFKIRSTAAPKPNNVLEVVDPCPI